MRKILLAILMFICVNAYAVTDSIVNVSPGFLLELREYNYDLNKDGFIQLSEALSFDTLKVLNENLDNFTGIEAFVNITYLNLSGNRITTLNLKPFSKLKYLYLSRNLLTGIDFTYQTKLKVINLDENKLSIIDVSAQDSLEYLNVSSNFLQNVNLTKNFKLKVLKVNNNQIQNLNLNSNVFLEDLNLSTNNIANLDLTQNTKLIYFYADENRLVNLDLSQNMNLEWIGLSFNQLINCTVTSSKLVSLNLSNNKISGNVNLNNFEKLLYLDLSNNLLTSLNSDSKLLKKLIISNNSLDSINLSKYNQLTYADISSNLKLNSICVNDLIFANDNFIKDSKVVWVTGCAKVSGFDEGGIEIYKILKYKKYYDFIGNELDNPKGLVIEMAIFDDFSFSTSKRFFEYLH